jgi:hypothetical protein
MDMLAGATAMETKVTTGGGGAGVLDVLPHPASISAKVNSARDAIVDLKVKCVLVVVKSVCKGFLRWAHHPASPKPAGQYSATFRIHRPIQRRLDGN